jgi:hypothetical protein
MIPPALSRALVSAARGHPFRRYVGSAQLIQAITHRPRRAGASH